MKRKDEAPNKNNNKMVRKAGTTRVSSYDTRNHCNILFQCYGSVFPRVISFCITNVLIMVAVKHISDRYGEYSSGLKISNVGHSFISLIVSFLLVSRVNTSLGRYNEARAYLGQMYRETRKFRFIFWIFVFYVWTRFSASWQLVIQLIKRLTLFLASTKTNNCR